MHCFSLLALACAAMLGTSSALVDAGVRTTVSVDANAYDKRTSGDGCSPSGCKPSLVRDGKRTSASRWSCNYDLADEDCEICFEFDEPQDIVNMKVAFHLGNTRQRSFYVNLWGSDDSTYSFTSSGTTTNFETFTLNSDETEELCLKAKNLKDSDWLSITEMQFMVK